MGEIFYCWGTPAVIISEENWCDEGILEADSSVHHDSLQNKKQRETDLRKMVMPNRAARAVVSLLMLYISLQMYKL